jgi:hypothetical protein
LSHPCQYSACDKIFKRHWHKINMIDLTCTLRIKYIDKWECKFSDSPNTLWFIIIYYNIQQPSAAKPSCNINRNTYINTTTIKLFYLLVILDMINQTHAHHISITDEVGLFLPIFYPVNNPVKSHFLQNN